MHWPEMFRLLTFPGFRTFWTFGIRNWTKIKHGFRMSESFAKLTKNFPKIKSFPKVIEVQNHSQKFWKSSKILVKTRYFQPLFSIPLIHTVQKHTQNRPSMLRSRDKPIFVFLIYDGCRVYDRHRVYDGCRVYDGRHIYTTYSYSPKTHSKPS